MHDHLSGPPRRARPQRPWYPSVRLAGVAVLWGLAGAWPARAADTPDAAALRTQALAATCATCHGTQGQAVDSAAMPGLAGLPGPYFSAQMAAFKAGQREATVMQQIAKGFSDAQIAQLAAYFAALPR
jgi:sulfide dehydrogenase cytochrome subunit